MLPHDPTGVNGPKVVLADKIEILEPVDEKKIDHHSGYRH